MAYSYLGGVYGFVRHENYDEFLRATGIKEEYIEECMKDSLFCVDRAPHDDPAFELMRKYFCGPMCPDEYIYFILTPSYRLQYLHNGCTIYDMYLGRIHETSTYTFNEWSAVQEIFFRSRSNAIKSVKGRAKVKMEFTKNDKMTMTITCDFWDGVARVNYSMHTENAQKFLIQQFPKKCIMSKISGRVVSNGVYVKKK